MKNAQAMFVRTSQAVPQGARRACYASVVLVGQRGRKEKKIRDVARGGSVKGADTAETKHTHTTRPRELMRAVRQLLGWLLVFIV